MKKKIKTIFYVMLFVILVCLFIFTVKKIKNDNKIKEKNTERNQNLLLAKVYTIENTYYGTEYTFQLLNNAKENEKYIKIQYYENETYSANIGHTLVGSNVEIKYQGTISKYMGEWDVGGQCFTLNLHDIISILPAE